MVVTSLGGFVLKERYLALSHRTHIIIWFVVGSVSIVAALYGFGWARDKIQQHRYEATRAADIKKATEQEKIAQEALQQAKLFQQQRDAAVKQADEAHKQLDEALAVLADATKTAGEKRKAYEEIKNRTAPVIVTGGESVDDLCARAAAVNHNIKCQ